MNKKITRRTALGVIVGGLAGTALVVHKLRNSCAASSPDGGGEKLANWERDRRLVDVPIRAMDGPATFVLDYRPQVGTTLRAACLYASYEKENYPKAPIWHSLANGLVAVRPPLAGDLPALVVVARESAKAPAGKCLAVPKVVEGVMDGFSYYEMTDSTPKELSVAQVNSSCRSLADAVMFNYPPGRTLAKGSQWTVPESLSHSVELPCEVVGFAAIAGRKTARIFAEQRLNNEQYQCYITRQWRDVKRAGMDPDADAHLREDLDRAVKHKQSFHVRVTFFIDLDSGICVRNEAVMSVCGPSYDHTAVQVSQVLDA